MIDLRSDTVTVPTPEMREVMAKAPVGDDIFSEDPSINALETYAAQLFGKEAALYCSSGTQTNQIAIKVHTVPGDEVVCSKEAHIYNYEGGGIAMNSGASVKLLDGDRGMFKASDVESAIHPDDLHYPRTSLVCLEDTSNRGGGAIWSMTEIQRINQLCQAHQLALHVDGARLFNALVETDVKASDYGQYFDSMSICLSKGLGAPVGSLLLGPSKFIAQARRVRKVFGGAMRQAGIIASAGHYALKNHIELLKKDNQHARMIGKTLEGLSMVDELMPVESNIVIFALETADKCNLAIDLLAKLQVAAFPVSATSIRFVFHHQVTDTMVTTLQGILAEIDKEISVS